jgi:hypothetical protein
MAMANGIRLMKIGADYGFDLFRKNREQTQVQRKAIKYLLYFSLSCLAFVVFIFIMAFIKQL